MEAERLLVNEVVTERKGCQYLKIRTVLRKKLTETTDEVWQRAEDHI